MAVVRTPSSLLFPTPSAAALKAQWIGRRIEELDAPAAILDRALMKRNCSAMWATVDKLGTAFRAHIKTHKTTEVTRYQIPDHRPLDLVTSTIAEIENLMPLILESIQANRPVDILYGIPPTKSAIERIISLNYTLQCSQPNQSQGHACISLLFDSEQHVHLLRQALDHAALKLPIGIFVKVDSGYQRAGITTVSSTFKALVSSLADEDDVKMQLRGFYTHLGHSYGFSTAEECLDGLMTEVESLANGATVANAQRTSGSKREPYILSVGATPTTTAAQNLLSLPDSAPMLQKWRAQLDRLRQEHCQLELHAGVYPFLDLQQMATGARPREQSQDAASLPATLSYENIAMRVLVEVASVYTERSKPEALIAAGNLAFGREPCKSYSGWGVVTPWRSSARSSIDDTRGSTEHYDPTGHRQGWILARVSQEHGILIFEAEGEHEAQEHAQDFSVGDKLCLWPNHACIAAAGYQYYYVVDSSTDDGDVIRDVWVRWRGW